jgi:hypothetical protein
MRGRYLYSKTAGYLYEAHLRDELNATTRRRMGPVRTASPTSRHPQPALDGFSTRRAEIEEEMTRRGVTLQELRRRGAGHRQAKDYQVDPTTLRPLAEQAQDFGLTPDMLAWVIDRIEPHPIGKRRADWIIREMIGPMA